jgi:hypothetical protein
MRILLKENSINVNAQSRAGSTALHLLVEGTGISEHFQLERLRVLLKLEGIELNLRDSQGRTPLGIRKNRTFTEEEDEKHV